MGPRRFESALVILFLIFVMTGCSETKKTTRLESGTPERIVSLTPAATEILFALGLGENIVGASSYSDYPPQANELPSIGDMTVNVEAVIALKPDLVVADKVLNDDVTGKLRKLGLTVYEMNTGSIDEVLQSISRLGKITTKSDKADEIIRSIEETIATVKKQAGNRKIRRSVLVVIQLGPLWAAGPETYADEMLEIAGAENIASDCKSGFVEFSKELAVKRDPEVILVGREEDKTRIMQDAAWKNTSAARNNRVYLIDSDLIVRAGPRLADGLEMIAEKTDF